MSKKELFAKKYGYSRKTLLEELTEKVNMVYDSGAVIVKYDFIAELGYPKIVEWKNKFDREKQRNREDRKDKMFYS